MEIQFQLSEADYVSANWAYMKRHWFLFLYNYRLPVGIAGAALAVIVLHPESSQKVAWVLTLGVALILYLWFLYRWGWRRQFERSGGRIVSASVNGESIRLCAGGKEATRRWKEFSDIYESGRVFVFATAAHKVWFFPKSVMSQIQISEVRQLITTHAKGRVKVASA